MLTVSLDTSALHAAAAQAVRDLGRGCEAAVDESGKAGKALARVLAPHRSYELRDKIEAQVLVADGRSALGELVAGAEHSSFVTNGTPPHVIEARRKKALRFESGGGLVFRRRVMHPGQRASDFFRRATERAAVVLVRKGEEVAEAVAARLSR